MLLQSGDSWHCSNPSCASELLIRFSREVQVDHVYCICGAVMKKPYAPPVFRYLDFLGDRGQQSDALPPAKFIQNHAGLMPQNARKE
jgi:hypothetical protein